MAHAYVILLLAFPSAGSTAWGAGLSRAVEKTFWRFRVASTTQAVPESPPSAPVRAAQYVRMSTEHQKYSTENQSDMISEYARRRGFEVVRTYADDGKSGLRIEGRDSLKRLIADVEGGRADFQAILVYDVSRWGRFQDADESAYYEYICKRAGIQVYYCAEQFENDGSLGTTIIKNMKRAMAGEYSRELSSKVFKGQCKLIQLGFRQGGMAGFGLRRMLLDQHGQSKGLLKRGEHKSLQTDRVVLVPGPDQEVAIVREIYRRFLKEGENEAGIATWLTGQGIASEAGGAWSRAMVRQILTNEKYIGNNVYNHISYKLKKKRVRNTPDMWVRADGVFGAVVDPESFFIARGVLQERARLFTDAEMLEKLRELFGRHRDLSAGLIDEAEGMPGSAGYRHRFGSLLAAYRLIGFAPNRDYTFVEVNRRLRALYPTLLGDTVQRLHEAGATVTHDKEAERLLINGEYSAAIVLGRCAATSTGRLRWRIHLESEKPPDITLAVRMDVANERPADYFILPFMDINVASLHLGEGNAAPIETYRFETLEYFVGLAARARVEVAA
jgi:DNA invertase Pin-like site-specific DNA recombinase